MKKSTDSVPYVYSVYGAVNMFVVQPMDTFVRDVSAIVLGESSTSANQNCGKAAFS